MRASDLLGKPVHEHTGHYLGVVTDLRCRQDGPLIGSMQAPRVYAVMISQHRAGSLLGYDRREHSKAPGWSANSSTPCTDE
jgi:hypothetical protein